MDFLNVKSEFNLELRKADFSIKEDCVNGIFKYRIPDNLVIKMKYDKEKVKNDIEIDVKDILIDCTFNPKDEKSLTTYKVKHEVLDTEGFVWSADNLYTPLFNFSNVLNNLECYTKIKIKDFLGGK